MSRQFPQVSARYGAPMGRSQDGYLETDLPRFVRLFRVRLNRQGYDDGGAYWGLDVDPLWCAMDDDGAQQFVRAASREQAAFLLDIGNPALKRRLYRNGIEYGLALLSGRARAPQHFPDGSAVTRASILDWLRACGAACGDA